MAKFKDGNGKEWSINLSVGLVEKIKEDTDVDLDEIITDPDKLSSIIFGPARRFVQVIYVACEAQIVKAAITPRDFGMLFTRPVIDAASTAMMEAMVDFYPRSSVGETIKGRMPELFKKMDDQLRQQTTTNIDRVLLLTATDLPG